MVHISFDNITTNSNRQTTEMGVDNVTPLIERLGREAVPEQFERELWKNCVESGAKNIVISPSWRDLEANLAQGKRPVYRYMIADDGCGMDEQEIKKYLNKISSSGHTLAVAGANHGLGAKISTLYWNRHGIIIMSWKNGIGKVAKIWKDPRPETRTFGRYGLAPFELDDGSINEFAGATDEYKPDFIKDHGTVVILCGDTGNEDTWQGPIGTNGEPILNKVYSHLSVLNNRFFRIPNDVTTSIFSMKENRKDWPLNEEEAKDRSKTSERKGNSHILSGLESQLLIDSLQHGTLEHPNFKIYWYWLNPNRSTISYFLQGCFVASLYQNEIYDLHRYRAAASYMAQFGIFRKQVQQQLSLIVEPNPAHLMTDTSRSRLIDARIYERNSTEKLPWNTYGEFFKDNMPEVIRAALTNLDVDLSTEELSKAIVKEIEEYAPYMSRNYEIAGKYEITEKDTSKKIAGKPKRRSENGLEEESKPRKPRTRQIDGSEQRNGLPPPPIIQWVSEASEEVPKGRAARYDDVNHVLFLNSDFSVLQIEIFRRLKEWDLNGDEASEKAIIEATRAIYSQKIIFTILHHYQNRDTEHWTSEEWERAISPEALTSCVLGMKWAESSINRYLANKFPELAQKKKPPGIRKKLRKVTNNILDDFKIKHAPHPKKKRAIEKS